MAASSLRTGALISALTGLLTACSSSASAGPAPLQDAAPMRLGEVQIVDRSTGECLPVYGHRGERWVAGVPGHRYSIRLSNRTDARLLAVMSVDGVNVLSGETAAWDQSGYVFAPGEGYEVSGWRKSQDRVAAFEFAALPDSYAARTGRPQNIGVIGLALFREAARPVIGAFSPTPGASELKGPDAPGSDRAEALAGALAPRPSSQSRQKALGAQQPWERSEQDRAHLGTAHGPAENSSVSLTEFERAQASPDQIITIRYDRRENLIAMGVIAIPRALPNAFPSSVAGFVPDPPSR